MSIKKLKEYKWRKNFTQIIGLKGHITAIHEKNSIVINVATNFARWYDLKVHIQILHEKDFEFNCDHCGKNFTKALYLKKHINTSWISGLKLQIADDHENKKI